jgi:hypothetical protein
MPLLLELACEVVCCGLEVVEWVKKTTSIPETLKEE